MKQIPKFSDHISSKKVNEAMTLTKEEIIEKFKLTLNSDGGYDAPGDVNLSEMGYTELPLKFGKVGGNFDCSYNKLTSLEGCPSEVGNNFWCSSNKLITLEGGPKSIGGNFWCTRNKLTSLKGCPKSIGGNFNCIHNKLTELPKELNCDILNIYTGNKIPLPSVKGTKIVK